MDKRCISKINSVFNPKYFKVYAVYEAGSNYMFGIKNRENLNDEPLDPWYMINKKTLKISGFAPHDDLKLFNEALKHPVDIGVK